jgi:GGDEF domain-containing protein
MPTNWDEVAQEAFPTSEAAAPPAVAPSRPVDWDALAGDLAHEQQSDEERQRAADAALVRYRDARFRVEPAKAAAVIRAAAATGWDPEHLAKNWTEFEPRLRPFLETQVDWEKVAARSPRVFGVVRDPVKGPVIREATAELEGVERWLTGRWEEEEYSVTPEEAERNRLERAELLAHGEADFSDAPTTPGVYRRRVQRVPDVVSATADKGALQQRYVGSSWKAMQGNDSPARLVEEANIQERLESELGVGGVERGLLGPVEMAPYLMGRVAASGATRAAVGGVGALVGGGVGVLAGGVGVLPGALTGFTIAENTLGHAADYAGGVAWDTYQNAGPLFRQLQQLKDESGNRVLTDEQARTYALSGSTLASFVTAGLGGKVVQAIPGVKGLLGTQVNRAVSQALVQETVPAAVKSLVSTGGAHLAAGALMMAVQSGANAATIESAAAMNSDHAFAWDRVGGAALDGLETGVKDMWLLSFWAPGRQFLGDFGRALESRRAADRLGAAAARLEAARAKLPAGPEAEGVVEDLVTSLAQEKGSIKQVYIRREAWDAAWARQGVDPAAVAAQVLGDGGKAYAETGMTGGDLVIPMGRASRMLLRAAGAKELVALDARVAPEHLSARELAADTAKRIERMKALAAAPEHVKAKEQVAEVVRIQAEQAGESSQRAKDAGRIVSEFVGNLAVRLGASIEEAAAFTGVARLRIQGAKEGKLPTLLQERVVGEALSSFFERLTPEAQERIRLAKKGITDSAQLGAIDWAFERAYRDEGTGAANKWAWDDHVKLHGDGGGYYLAIDANDLKFFNDTFGHDAGNQMLRVVADSLRGAADEHGGFSARTGGDELSARFPTRETAARGRDAFLRRLAAAEPIRTVEDIAGLTPDLAERARGALGEGQAAFRASVRVGLGPTMKLADLGEQASKMARIAKYGDIRTQGGKVIAGHGESFTHDALDPTSPHYAEAMAEMAKRGTPEGGVPVAKLEQATVAAKDRHGGITFVLDDGSGKPLEATITLTDPNPSTLLHELNHFFVEALSRMASRGELTDPGIRADYAGLLRYGGYADQAGRIAEGQERTRLAEREGKLIREGGLSLEERRRLTELKAKEERVTYAWEQYLLEGKAPSAELAGVFHRFSRWLSRVYQGTAAVAAKFKSIYGKELEVTPEIVGIFDRLLASQAEIDRAKAAEEMAPFRPALERMTPAERTHWAELDARDRMAAEARVIRALVHDDRAQVRQIAEAERGRARAEVEAEVDRNPTYRAISYLATGALEKGKDLPPTLSDANGQPWKLDRRALVKRYGADFVRTLPQEGLAEKRGLSADELAPELGFRSGDQMLRAIAAAEPRAQAIQRQVAKRVLDRLGPALLDDPQRLQEVTMEAAHTEAAAEKILLERRALARELDPERARGIEPDREYLKALAGRILEGKTVGEIAPSYYLHAERRVAREALDLAAQAAAAPEGRKRQELLARAYDLKEVQLLNQALYRAASDLRERLDGAYERLGKTAADRWRAKLGQANPAYRDVHDSILAAIGFPEAASAPKSPGAAAKAIEAMLQQAADDAVDLAFDVDPIRELVTQRLRWTDLTVEEAQNVVDAVTNIRRAANHRNEIRLADKRATKDDVLAEMSRTAAVLPEKPKRLQDPNIEGVSLRRGLNGLGASTLGIEAIVLRLDYGAGRDGIFHRAIWDGYLAARNKENDLARAYGKVIDAAWEKLPKVTQRSFHERIDLTGILPITEDLAKSSGLEGTAVSRTWLLMLALNMGNAGNKQRLLDGYGWSEGKVFEALGHLTREELNFAQAVLDSLEGLYPEIEALHERDTGLKPGKVTATPIKVQLADGTTWEGRGGYFPAKYDPRPGMSLRAYVAQEAEIGAILDPQSRYPGTLRSHTKARSEQVKDLINLSWSVVPTHVAQVLHDLAFREYIRQTAAIVVDPRFEATLNVRLGEGYSRQFRPWLQQLANARFDAVSADVRETFDVMAWGKGKVMVAALGHNVANALGDILNPLMAVAGRSVRLDYMAAAGKRLIAGGSQRSRAETWRFCIETSPELRERREKGLEHLRRHMDEMAGMERNVLQKRAGTAAVGDVVNAAQQTAFFAQEAMDKLTSTQVWLGAYLQQADAGTKSGRPDPHSFAVRAADDVVRKWFPSESKAERPAFQRKAALAPFVMFWGYFAKILQVRREKLFEIGMAWRDKELPITGKLGVTARNAGDLLAMAVVLAASDLMTGRGPEQKDDSWAEWLGRKMAGAQVLDFPIIGPPLAAYAEKKLGAKGPSFSMRAAPGLAIGEAAMRKLEKTLGDKSEPDEAFWAGLGLAGLLSGVPTVGVTRPGRYVTSGRAGEDLEAGRFDELLSGPVYGERDGQPYGPVTGVAATLRGELRGWPK